MSPEPAKIVDRKFAALADPTRRQLLIRLRSGPQEAGRLAGGFPVSRPAIAKHLRVLLDAGLVEVEAAGRRRLYRLAPGGLKDARAWIEEADRLWDAALRAFQRHVEEEKP